MDIADVHPGNIGSHEQFQVFHAILDYKVIFYMSWLVSACEIVIYITGCRGVCALFLPCFVAVRTGFATIALSS